MDDNFDGPTYQADNRLASLQFSAEELTRLVRELTQSEVTEEDIEYLFHDRPVSPAQFSSILLSLYDWFQSEHGKSEREATECLGELFPKVPDFRFVRIRHAAQIEAYRRDIHSALASGSNLAETLPPDELLAIRAGAQTTSLRRLRAIFRKVLGDSSELKLQLILNPPEPLFITIEMGDASQADIDELMRRMAELYVHFGGSGLNYELLEIEELEGVEA